ncbi:MAG: PP2C family protein-serine/threonine phosphatase [Caldilineaceae bacterium]
MNETILNSLIESQHPVLEQLANAWEALGASEFSITAKDVHEPQNQVASDENLLTEIICVNGSPVGWLSVRGSSDLRPRLRADAQIISTLVQQEYEIEKMTSELIDQQDQLMALHQLANATRRQYDFQQMLESLAAVAARLLKAEGAFMELRVQENEPHLGVFPREEWAQRLWSSLIIKMESASVRNPLLLQGQDPALKKLGIPIRNLLANQIWVRTGVSLILGVVNKLGGDFQTPDVKLLSTISEPTGASLENALLQRDLLNQTRIQTEMELAKQVQMRLLPQQIPHFADLDLAVHSRPAFQVGGDFYDFVESKDHRLNFVVGDVSGKGMPAALLMTMMRTALRGRVQESQLPAVDRILDGTNQDLYQDFSDVDMFATVFLGQYDAQTQLLHYANQGHSPVIYRPQGGSAKLLIADAPPLGVLPLSLAQAYTIKLCVGDLLIMASDGFSEAERSDGEMFGYDRMLQLVDQFADESANGLLERMFEAVQNFAAGHRQSDDQTILVLKRI